MKVYAITVNCEMNTKCLGLCNFWSLCKCETMTSIQIYCLQSKSFHRRLRRRHHHKFLHSCVSSIQFLASKNFTKTQCINSNDAQLKRTYVRTCMYICNVLYLAKENRIKKHDIWYKTKNYLQPGGRIRNQHVI